LQVDLVGSSELFDGVLHVIVLKNGGQGACSSLGRLFMLQCSMTRIIGKTRIKMNFFVALQQKLEPKTYSASLIRSGAQRRNAPVASSPIGPRRAEDTRLRV
jgi:hypothetical protein